MVSVSGAPVDAAVLTRMAATLRDRGPDHQAQWHDHEVALAATRLRILDLSPSGDQPMRRGDFTIVYNGEVYNHRALRARLEARGVTFQSHTDTEVVLEALRTWGSDVISELDGMFAFALWDGASRRLTLARDRFGVKP